MPSIVDSAAYWTISAGTFVAPLISLTASFYTFKSLPRGRYETCRIRLSAAVSRRVPMTLRDARNSVTLCAIMSRVSSVNTQRQAGTRSESSSALRR